MLSWLFAMDPEETLTRSLLKRLHEDDSEALRRLLERDLEWIEAQVRRRLGNQLRQKAETMDFVQEAVVNALRHGPRFLVSDQDQFRALMARIVENSLRKQHRFHHQQKRDAGRQEPLPSESLLDLDGSRGTPSHAAEKAEHRAWVQLGIELLDETDREVIRLRQWEGMQFATIGEQLEITEDTARMRFKRALARLAKTVKTIRNGGIDSALRDRGT